ncbi:hypothetical protein E2C01_079506 [Portunus trituberculatus]|uniref:Protein FMC1 homolog n=1 Tax=Portunus trituberculatus TaxID=210409 RepID=A0A5B7ITI0_PORTR|nr:hypothetical protein [Portunus trituberculatus]
MLRHHITDMAATTPKIQTLRCLIREIRRTLLPHENLRHSPAFEYMMKEYRHNAVTDQQCCRQQEEMAYLAHTCATYLEASRRWGQTLSFSHNIFRYNIQIFF